MMVVKVRSRLLMTAGNRPRISLAAGMAEDDVDDCWVIAVNEQKISFFIGNVWSKARLIASSSPKKRKRG